MSHPSWEATLPKGWRAERLRHVADISNSNVDKKTYEGGRSVRLCNYTDVYYNDAITNGMEFMVASATPQEIQRFQLRRGDVIITKDSETWDDIAVAACVTEDLDDVVCGYHLALIRGHQNHLNGSFLLRTLQAQGIKEQFWLAARGVTRFGLGQQGMKDALIPVPPLLQQKAIADFLDCKTAAIDALIAKKRKLVELLAEKRAALINQAVTKGLDPTVPMKNSGIPWIGEIPAHWELRRLGYAVLLRSGDSLENTQYEDSRSTLNCIPVIGGNGVLGWCARHNTLGDIMAIGRVGALCGNVHHVSGRAWVTDNALCLKVRQWFATEFLVILLRARGLNEMADKNAQPLITGTKVKDQRLPVPPRAEQEAIVRQIIDRNTSLDAAERALVQQISRLQEYRQALITATVTGQLEIPVTEPEEVSV